MCRSSKLSEEALVIEAFIYDAIRSPRGKAKPEGGLHDLSPFELLAPLYDAICLRTGLDAGLVGEVVLGCVTQYGEQAGNIAKSSALYAGWPSQVSGLTINRFCSSGLDAINIAALKVNAGQEEVAVAGGIEMMSRVPMMSDQAAIFKDPEVALAARILLMGSGADLIASLYGASRQDVDEVALMSQQRAALARDSGFFTSVIPIDNPVKARTIYQDECIRGDTTLESLGKLPASFESVGKAGADAVQLAHHDHLQAIAHVHTAGNSPAMADAAALVLVGAASLGEKISARPRAVIRAMVNASDDPLQVLTGCVAATEKLLRSQKLSVDDIDLFEIHEAFAATVLKARADLGIPIEKLNVNGGVIAMGHPLGATGSIMMGMLLDEMERRDLTLGVVATSGAAGLGTAILIERLSS
ncbi:acetyl-CoA C-acyltransferase [Luminiphilus sp.]|nr:acetyl-CoA C-acyltransferase [Luminiphilus sp.]